MLGAAQVHAVPLDGSTPVFSVRTANLDNPLFGGLPDTQVGAGTATTDNFATDTEVGALRGDIRDGSLGMVVGAVSPSSGLPLTDYNARFFDFITLGTTVDAAIGRNFDVTFQIALDGTHLLEGDSTRSATIATQSSFFLFDVTGLADPFEDNSATGGILSASDTASFVDGFGLLQESTLNRSGRTAPAAQDPVTHLADNALSGAAGEKTVVDEVLSKTITLQAGRTYLAQYGIATTLLLDTASSDGLNKTNAVADFFNTSQLSITDLGGAQISSASGVFLADATVTATVPLPASVAMLGLGIFALAAGGRLTRQTRRG